MGWPCCCCCCCRSPNLDIPVKKEKKVKAVRLKRDAKSKQNDAGNSSSEEEEEKEEQKQIDLHSVTGASDANGFEYPLLVRVLCCICCFLCCRSTDKSKEKYRERQLKQRKVHAEFDPEEYGIDPTFIVKTKNFGKQMTADRRRELTASLQKVTLLSSLPEPQMNAVIDEMRPTRFPPGAMILRRGDVGHHCFVIEEGEVTITDIKGAPSDLVVVIGPGSFLGERALLSGDVRSATVAAKSEVSLLLLTREAFDRTLGPLKPVIEQVTADKHKTLAFFQEMQDMKKRVIKTREDYRQARMLLDFSPPLEVCKTFQARVEAGNLNPDATAGSNDDDTATAGIVIMK